MEEPTSTAVGIAMIVGTAVSAAGTAYSAYQTHEQMGAAKKSAKEAAAQAASERASILEKQKQEEATIASRNMRSQQMRSGQAKSPTILTTPLGLPKDSVYTGKTLLGGGSL